MANIVFAADTFMSKLIEPTAIGTILLALATFISTFIAFLVPRQIFRREADKAERDREARRQMVCAILNGFSQRIIKLRRSLDTGVSSNEVLRAGVSEMLTALLAPDVCAAIGDSAFLLYATTLEICETVADDKWTSGTPREQRMFNSERLDSILKMLAELSQKICPDGGFAVATVRPIGDSHPSK